MEKISRLVALAMLAPIPPPAGVLGDLPGLGPAAASHGKFVERASELGLDVEYMSGMDRMLDTDLFDWVQSGVAIADIDGDADLDVVAACGLQRNRVYLNALGEPGGGAGFVDFTADAGINAGEFDRVPALADIDNDGDLDLFLGALGPGQAGPATGRSRLYTNDGTGRFEEITTLAHTQGSGYSIYANWYDADFDGWVDLYVSEFHATRNRWYRNNGGGNFAEDSEEVGIHYLGSTHVSSFLDSDLDGYPDLFVGNDWPVTTAASLPGNVGDAHFQGLPGALWFNVSVDSNYDVKRGIMGITVGDVNYDGLPDIYKTDAGHNFLMLNTGWPGSGIPWAEVQDDYGVANAEVVDPSDPENPGQAVGWAAVFMNVDLDPWRDLLVVNGQVPSKHPDVSFSPSNQQNFLYLCAGPGEEFKFLDVTEGAGVLEYVDDRGAAVGDMDRDGDLDMLIAPTSGQMRYFENQFARSGQGWLAVEPICQTSAPGAGGVQVRWTDSEGYPHLRMLGSEAPTASQNDLEAFFGLGLESQVDVSVRFPSGIELTYEGVPANTRMQAIEPKIFEISTRMLPALGTGGSGPGPGTGSGNAIARAAVTGTLVGEPAGLLPGGSDHTPEDDAIVVAVFAHGSDGTPLDETAEVSITAGALVPLGDVYHVTGNQFRRGFRATTEAGEYRVVATMNGFTPAIQPRVFLRGAVEPTKTLASIRPESVRAGTDDTYSVEIVLRDGNRLAYVSDLTLEVRRSGELDFVLMTDLGDGRYLASLDSPTEPGLYLHEFLLGGEPTVPFGAVTAAGAPEALMTEGYTEVPPQSQSGLNMGAPHQMRVLVTPMDSAARPLGPGVVIDVALTHDPGTDAVVWRSDLLPSGKNSGEHLVVFEKPLGSQQGSATGNYSVSADGVVIWSGTYDF